MQAFIDESLDNVLPKFRQCAKDFTHLLCTLLKILNKIFKIEQKRMGQYKKCVPIQKYLCMLNLFMHKLLFLAS